MARCRRSFGVENAGARLPPISSAKCAFRWRQREPESAGRNGFGAGFSLHYNSQFWRKDSGGTWNLGRDDGFGYGWKLQAGALTPVYSGYFTIDHYVFIDSTGAEYRLDVNNGGVWTSREGIYLELDTNSGILYFPDGTKWAFACTSGGT